MGMHPRWLGPAFGTKFLYFCQAAASDIKALIFDNLVATWLRREAPPHLDPCLGSVPNYSQYLGHMHRWLSALDCSADDLEYPHLCSMASEQQPVGRDSVLKEWQCGLIHRPAQVTRSVGGAHQQSRTQGRSSLRDRVTIGSCPTF